MAKARSKIPSVEERSRGFMAKAEGFAEMMDAAYDKGQWEVVAIMGLHAAISATDSVTMKFLGPHGSSERHEDALARLRAVKAPRAREAAENLRRIIRGKAKDIHSPRRWQPTNARRLAKRARFVVDWAKDATSARRGSH
jgi:hypothetical protein